MRWSVSHRGDPPAVRIADRHYNRQKPGTSQFVPPGACLVLLTKGAAWTTSWPKAEYVKHRWPGAWVNSLFRKEVPGLASEFIIEAVAATRWTWPDVPELGMVTFVDREKVESENPGYCYLMAGFERDGETEGGLLAFRMSPERMPDPEPPLGAALPLFVSGVGVRDV